jgi:hypothetical protein
MAKREDKSAYLCGFAGFAGKLGRVAGKACRPASADFFMFFEVQQLRAG